MNDPNRLILDGTKLAWHADTIRAWLAGERIAPITVDCALSSSCTYQCVYCYGQLQRMNTGSWSRDMTMRFLDDAAEIGVKAISFVSDGESTCSPHLAEAVLHGKANGLDMALASNGYLLRDGELPDILPALTYLRFNISSGIRDGYCRIHGVPEKCYDKVLDTIRKAVVIKQRDKLDVTLGLQMVLMPEFANEILPLARLGAELGVDYLVIKHCSDDEAGHLGVDYSGYAALDDLLRQAEALSTPGYAVHVKWSKIKNGRHRCYEHCYGPPFILQLSGSGLVAPCGMLFNDQYKRYHIGSLQQKSFKEIWQSDRYWEVMKLLADSQFDARKDCGCLCLQHKANEFLWQVKEGAMNLDSSSSLYDEHWSRMMSEACSNKGEKPQHINFI